ncbi:olfactory receptor 10AC1-like [Paroedura picta]|uniref:olfactory receptor 10AC1-like n=1 Tax=Paroedura picta TaxID=143630 RepID=UPI004056AEAC
MDRSNRTSNAAVGFVLLGFSDLHHLRGLLFFVFFTVLLATLAGNLLILLAVATEHTRPPMLLFLCQLSAIELCYTLVIVPRTLADLVTPVGNPISFVGCATQMYFFAALGGAECFLLLAMSYDRYVAICRPLHYAVMMSQEFCLHLAVICCLGGFAVSLGLTVAVFRLPFCRSHRINHFFCDIPALLHLACTKSYTSELPLLAACIIVLLLPFVLILVSYSYITAAVLRIRDSAGRGKAFSTCASHLAVALLHYGCASFMYVRPKSSYSPKRDKMLSLFYTNITPLLYPLIYSLRNKEIKGAVRKLLQKKVARPNWDILKCRSQP